MLNSCVFCNQYLIKKVPNAWAASGVKYGQTTDIIFESVSFVAVAGLGAIEEGYVLLMPKQHNYCMGQLDNSNLGNLIRLKDQMKTLVQYVYGNAVLIEHGMTSCDPAGGCIDHAHIHIVPSRVNFRSYFSSALIEKKITSLFDLQILYQEDIPYLFYEDNSGLLSAYFTESKFPSQYFRRIWAREVGDPDAWDWSVFPEEVRVAKTISKLRHAIEADWQVFKELQEL